MFEEFGTEVGNSEDAIHIATDWKDDEEIRRRVVHALLFNSVPIDSQYSPVGEYLADFPNSVHFQLVPVDMERPLESLRAALGDLPDTSDVDAQVAAARLPICISAAVHNTTYAEAIVVRAAIARFAGTNDIDGEILAIRAAENAVIVVDSTALFTQILLPEITSVAAAGLFASQETTAEQFRDSVGCLARMKRASGLRYVPAAGGDVGSLRTVPEEDRTLRIQEAQRLHDRFEQTARVAHPELVVLPGFAGNSTHVLNTALSALDHAAAHGLAFWSDDLFLRRMASEIGVPSFGTVALLEFLCLEGRVNHEILEASRAALIVQYYVGIDFDSETYALAMRIDGDSPRGVAVAMMHGGGDKSNERLTLLMDALAASAQSPESLRDWSYTLARWLLHVSTAVEGTPATLSILIRQILGEAWCKSSCLPFVIQGIRAAAEFANESIDPVLDGFGYFHAGLKKQVGTEIAATFMLELASQLRDDDRQRVTLAILS
ncbi:hypothetical protein KIV56_00980 [Cryobacterium breve]|uniref:PIN domain-containing protein n=1 Tax=Cryobacterium breve TaxID=1259258 RepID=A0ABY7NF11_9MICO|nr:hypothetical protein [Cryobacterium breve]WBM80195.1 hypothetical protein KIV56_00980 [Cryobacterium breve]